MSYSQGFYQTEKKRKLHAARVVLDHFLQLVGPVESAADLGCGVGVWLHTLSLSGTDDFTGYDGPWVADDALLIPPERLKRVDLGEALTLERRYDLAISLEVAEHVPACSAPTFVQNLTALSDLVLFSAAVPGQGGKHHINEQWPEYWAELFAERGYQVCDVLRSHFWYDQRIPAWYRQNMLVFATEDALAQRPRLRRAKLEAGVGPLSIVHPERWLGSKERWWSKPAREWPPQMIKAAE